MKTKLNVFRLFAVPLLVAVPATPQVSVALSDVGSGVAQAGITLAWGAIRTASGVVTAVPIPVGIAVISGVTAGTVAFVTPLALGGGEIALNAGASMLISSAGAAKHLSSGLVRAGWHLAFPRRIPVQEEPRCAESHLQRRRVHSW